MADQPLQEGDGQCWHVYNDGPQRALGIVWSEQEAERYRGEGWEVQGPFVPLSVAENLAAALVEVAQTSHELGHDGRLAKAERALAVFRAAYPREEGQG